MPPARIPTYMTLTDSASQPNLCADLQRVQMN
jgi:hypothetical protein